MSDDGQEHQVRYRSLIHDPCITWYTHSEAGRHGAQGLQLEFGSSPVSSLCVVADRVSRLHPDPLWHRTVLLLLLRQLAFDDERLMRRLFGHNQQAVSITLLSSLEQHLLTILIEGRG